MQKILAYLSGHQGLINFGMLKKLQEKIPIKIYAIIDQGQQPKEFYQKQKFVRFEKIWHYTDFVKPFSKPNIKYLKKIEDEFQINLWKIAYSDPAFYEFDGKSDFKEDEILSLIEEDCKLFENIIKEVNPDFLVTHTAGQKQANILREMCMSKQIRILQYSSAKFGLRIQISQEYDVLDKFENKSQISVNEKLTDEFINELEKELNLKNYYKKISKDTNKNKKEFFKGTFSNIRNIKKESDKHYINLKNPNIVKRYLKIFKKNISRNRRKKFLDQNFIKIIPENEKFIIFPLHMQPEHTTSVVTPFFTDQISLIENIARSLPVNYFLYVKEHPSMGTMRYWREIKYYKKILEIPNVRAIHPNVNSLTLYKKSQIILTINGSASNESLLLKKPVIVFANVASIEADAINKVENMEEMPEIIKKVLEKKFEDTGSKRFFTKKLYETMEIQSPTFLKDMHEKLFIKGIQLFNITEKGMEKLLEDNKIEYDRFAEEYLRKIAQWNKFENKID